MRMNGRNKVVQVSRRPIDCIAVQLHEMRVNDDFCMRLECRRRFASGSALLGNVLVVMPVILFRASFEPIVCLNPRV